MLITAALSLGTVHAEDFEMDQNPRIEQVGQAPDTQHSAIPYAVGYISISGMLLFTGFIISDAVSTISSGNKAYAQRPVIDSPELIHQSLHRAKSFYN